MNTKKRTPGGLAAAPRAYEFVGLSITDKSSVSNNAHRVNHSSSSFAALVLRHAYEAHLAGVSNSKIAPVLNICFGLSAGGNK